MKYKFKQIILVVIGIVIGLTALSFGSVSADPIKTVIVDNLPEVLKVEEAATKTIVLGSKDVYVNAGDLINIPALPDNEVMIGSYTGSGTVSYIVGRGNNDAFGIKIVIDGETVAKANGHPLDILGSDSDGWRVLRDTLDVIEVNQDYHFSESVEIYVFNHSFSPITGGAHIELEVSE